MPALIYYWRKAPIHAGAISLFFQATIDAIFQPVAYPLGAAAQSVERYAQTLRHRQPPVDLLAFLVAVILQDQLPAFDRQFIQASLETILFFVSFFNFGSDERGGGELFKIRPPAVRAFQPFKQDQPGHAVAIGGNVSDALTFVNFADDAVDRLVGAFFREMRAAPVEEFHQCQAQAFIFFAGAI